MGTTITITVVGLVLVAAVIYFIIVFNRFVRYKKTMESALSDVDVHLKKRFDLLPILEDTVKGYAEHESDVFKKVTEIRSTAMQMTTLNDRAEFDDTLKGLFKSLFAVAENYPALRADGNFLKLQGQVHELENNIESARRYYNAVTRDNNIYVDSFPSNIVAGVFGFSEGEYFDMPDEQRETPGTSFSGSRK